MKEHNICDDFKIKAKRIDNGEWTEGDYCPKKAYCFDSRTPTKPTIITEFSSTGIVCFEIDKSTICRPTGLVDKNTGKEIWEHDFVFVTDDDGYSGQTDTGLGEVLFLEGLWYVNGSVQNGLYDINKCFQIKVVGNFFDNPELHRENQGAEQEFYDFLSR